MLFFSRWKAAGILLTALVVCLFALPNFVSENTLRKWPGWAQRHIVLGLDLQGGSSLLLEIDTAAVRKERLQGVADDVLRILRQNRIPFTGRTIRNNSVEVRLPARAMSTTRSASCVKSRSRCPAYSARRASAASILPKPAA